LPLLEVSLKQSSEAEASGTRVGDGYEDGSRPIVENEQFAFLPEPQDAQTLEPAPTEEDEETSALILIVEDNADMRAYLRAHLSPPYRVLEAPHGKEGVRLAQEWVPDLVLSDVMMPEMDGLTLTDVLKTDVRTSHIPVMLLTAKAEVEDRIAGYESGADAYLPKPFDAEELRVRVRGLIEERQRLRVLFGGTESITAEEQAARALPPQEAEFMARVQEAVEAHLGDATFGVEQLAEAVHMSRRQLLRKLQALITESPSELLRRARLERATCLLKEGHSVKEVAHAVGFKNYASFSRAFNSAYGVLPSAYGQDA
jgi:DNA-binding response OmpR family regulator